MEAKDLDYVRDTIECEGFEYAFVDYSHFEEVKDERFHELRRAFVKARQELAEYLNVD